MVKYPNTSTGILTHQSQVLPKLHCLCHKPKVNSVCFDKPYDQINYIENTNNETHLVYEYEENTREY